MSKLFEMIYHGQNHDTIDEFYTAFNHIDDLPLAHKEEFLNYAEDYLQVWVEEAKYDGIEDISVKCEAYSEVADILLGNKRWIDSQLTLHGRLVMHDVAASVDEMLREDLKNEYNNQFVASTK